MRLTEDHARLWTLCRLNWWHLIAVKAAHQSVTELVHRCVNGHAGLLPHRWPGRGMRQEQWHGLVVLLRLASTNRQRGCREEREPWAKDGGGTMRWYLANLLTKQYTVEPRRVLVNRVLRGLDRGERRRQGQQKPHGSRPDPVDVWWDVQRAHRGLGIKHWVTFARYPTRPEARTAMLKQQAGDALGLGARIYRVRPNNRKRSPQRTGYRP